MNEFIIHVEGSQQLHDDVMEILAEMEAEGFFGPVEDDDAA